jgi:hypothetical protein
MIGALLRPYPPCVIFKPDCVIRTEIGVSTSLFWVRLTAHGRGLNAIGPKHAWAKEGIL